MKLLLLRFFSLHVNTTNTRRLRTALFWVVINPYLRFGTTCMSHFQELRNQEAFQLEAIAILLLLLLSRVEKFSH